MQEPAPKLKAVYCTGAVHRAPKILFCYDDSGVIYVQCPDWECKKASPGKGWHRVEFTNTGSVILTPLKEAAHFDLKPMPAMIREPA